MLYLLLSILLNVAVFMAFRLFSLFGVRTLPAIVVNYFVCVLTGLVFLGNTTDFATLISFDSLWVYFGFLLGLLFIVTFNLMALTTQRLGVTISSIAAKMSLAIPVLFSLFIFQIESKAFNFLNYLGLLLAFVSVYLSSLKKEGGKKELTPKSWQLILLPLGVFICSGIIDTLINYTSFHYLSDPEAAIFPLVIFIVAGVAGLGIQLVSRQKTGLKDLIAGIGLGIPNYFSIYFIVKALAAFQNNGAFFYPILNISIILFSSIFAIIFFKEKLILANKIGLILAVLAILLISYQEISAYLAWFSYPE